jgi:hypothetical protein
MHMVGHGHEFHAPRRQRFQKVIEHAEHNPFRPIEIKQAPALGDRKRNEVDVVLLVKAPSLIAIGEGRLREDTSCGTQVASNLGPLAIDSFRAV